MITPFMCGRSHSGVVGRLGDLHPTDLGWIGESEFLASWVEQEKGVLSFPSRNEKKHQKKERAREPDNS